MSETVENRNYRKRIAVLVAQADSMYQKFLMSGILREAEKRDMDVAVFATFIKISSAEDTSAGEYNIFNIINDDVFDGYILASDTIRESGWLERVAKRVRDIAGDKPIVSLDYDVEGFETFMTDDSDGVEKVIDHLIDVHGCKKINYFSGEKGHPHSERRIVGYKRSLEKHGIAYDENRVFYGGFWHERIEEYIDMLEKSPEGMPEAIGVVSDHNAIIMAEALIKRGYRVPEDIIVVGYDHIDEISEIFGGVTTIKKASETTGSKAVRYIYETITGEKVDEPFVTISQDIVIGGTCGCEPEVTVYNKKRNISIYDGDFSFYSGYNFMLEDLIKQTTTRDFFWTIDYYRTFVKDFDGIYIALNTDWEGGTSIENEEYRTLGYTDEMILMYKRDSQVHRVELGNFDTKLILPDLYQYREKPAVFYFMPVHFQQRAFGYIALMYEGKPVVFNPDFGFWVKYINASLESLRRHNVMKKLNFALEEMYQKVEKEAITDMLTGINNRNTYNRFADAMYSKAMRDNSYFFALFADLNNLKYINDYYGHDHGDDAIVVAAEAIKSSCVGNEKCFRIGGDEFVIVGCGMYTEDIVNEHYRAIEKKLNDFNERSEHEYNISISLGATYTACHPSIPVERVLADADQKMIAVKKATKASPDYINVILKPKKK